MTTISKDTGVITTLLNRFKTQRLPRTLELKEKVDLGNVLNDFDIAFLDDVTKDSAQIMQLVDRHPEYEPLVIQAYSLCKEITEKAIENEKL